MVCNGVWCHCFVVCQAEDGIRDLVRSRGLGDVYKRQGQHLVAVRGSVGTLAIDEHRIAIGRVTQCLVRQELSLIHI